MWALKNTDSKRYLANNVFSTMTGEQFTSNLCQAEKFETKEQAEIYSRSKYMNGCKVAVIEIDLVEYFK